jgi:hypothetical protein
LTAAILSALVALFVYRSTRKQGNRRVLHDGFDRIWTDDTEGTMNILFAATPTEIIHDKTLQVSALEFFLQFQRSAASVSSAPDDWDKTLDQHQYSRLRKLMKHCTLLFEVVRHTQYPMERHAWNGTRRHAFDALLKAMRVRIPLPPRKLQLE